MTRRPPNSPLFPSPPLFRSEPALPGHPIQRITPNPECPAGQAPSGSVRDHGIWASPATPAQQAPGWPYELSAASLLAAGVLAALGRKRRGEVWGGAGRPPGGDRRGQRLKSSTRNKSIPASSFEK